MLVMLVWRHSTPKHFWFHWIRESGFANPDSRTEWTVSLNPTRIQIRIRQIEYTISYPTSGPVSTEMGDRIWASIPPRYVNSVLHPSGSLNQVLAWMV